MSVSAFVFIYLWLCSIFVAACGLSLVAESGSDSPVAMRGLLVVVASLVVGHSLKGVWAQ